MAKKKDKAQEGFGVKSLIQKLGDIKFKLKALKDEEAKFIKQIKEAMEASGENVIDADTFVATLVEKSSGTFDQAALLEMIQKKYGQITYKKIVKEVLDEEKLEAMIFSGKLNAKEIRPFQKITITKALTVKHKGGK